MKLKLELKQTLFLAVVGLVLAVAAGIAFHRICHAGSKNTSFHHGRDVLSESMCNGTSSEEEREALLAAMNKQSAADKDLAEAETQVEMNSASGGMLSAIEPYLAKSAEYRLRRLGTTAERTALLQQLIDLTDSLRSMYDESLEGAGSVEPMLRHLRGEHLIRRQAEIWLLPDAEYQDWIRLADAKLAFDGMTVQLKNGMGRFKAERYDDQYELEVSIEPDHWFKHDGKCYAVIVEDIENSLNSDFLRLHLCRLDDSGILRSIMELETFYLARIEVKGNTLILHGNKTHGDGEYRKEILIPKL